MWKKRDKLKGKSVLRGKGPEKKGGYGQLMALDKKTILMSFGYYKPPNTLTNVRILHEFQDTKEYCQTTVHVMKDFITPRFPLLIQ